MGTTFWSKQRTLALLLVLLNLIALIFGVRYQLWHRFGRRRIISNRIIVLESSHWYRFGNPFHKSAISTIALAFNISKTVSPATSATNQSLLFYAQSLDGVFNPDRRQYIAATISQAGISVFTKVAGTEKPSRVFVKGRFMDGSWQALYVLMTSSQIVARVDSFGKGIPSARALQSTLAKMKAVQKTEPFHVDSGLYLSGVVDSNSISMAMDFPHQLSALSGQIVPKVIVNGDVQDLDSPNTSQGVVDEKLKEKMIPTLKKMLVSPLASIPSKLRDMSDPTILRFPVITAVSDNHVKELTDMIASVGAVMKERGILVYNLGINESNVQNINSFCNVSVRNVRSDVFMEELRNLMEYRWKPVIIHSALQEFGGVLYADASIRFKQSIANIGLLRNGPGFVGFGPEGTSPTGAFTHDVTLQSLGVERVEVVNATMTISGILIWMADEPTVHDVLMGQWLGCALSGECMAPNGSTPYGCQWELKQQGKFIGCHRFDQSALSVVLWKVFHDINANSYQLNYPEDVKFATIERDETHHNRECRRSNDSTTY